MANKMASELFGKANDEFINENYQKAVELYTEALDQERNRDDIFCNRAQANLKLENYKEAAEDATEALSLNPKNTKACLRKGIALFHLEDYQSAKDAFTEGQSIDADDNNFKTWVRKCEAELDLQEKNKTTQSSVGLSETKKEDAAKSEPCDNKTETNSKPVQPVVPMPTREKSRYDWYQTQTHVVLTLLLKNIQEEDANISIQEKSFSATVKLPSGSDYSLELDLSHPINPAQSMTKFYKSKIEVKLKKLEGLQWHKLEGDESNLKQILAEESEHVMEYPSSCHYTRNWDKLAKEAEEDDKNDKKEGDAALNDLFQKIYADGTDETKRAMAKSFYESGGTVLSTNWNEIGAKPTDVKPPDGMEYKKWNS